MAKEILNDIPADMVDWVIKNYEDAGCLSIEKVRQNNGKYTIIVECPESK